MKYSFSRKIKSVLQIFSFASAIDPCVVGLVAMQKALRENTILEAELKKDGESMECLKKLYYDIYDKCPCDVPYHPKHWTVDVIQAVHDHSFLLDCKVAPL